MGGRGQKSLWLIGTRREGEVERRRRREGFNIIGYGHENGRFVGINPSPGHLSL